MKRLLKIVTIFFVVVTILMSLLECFDRWDKPGLSNDTEFPVFLIVLFVALVLLALVAMARRFFDRQNDVLWSPILYEFFWDLFSPLKELVVEPFVIPPLRI